MGSFVIDIAKFREKLGNKADLVLRKVGIETYEKVKQKTPVDTGQLRASWTVSVNGMPQNYNGDISALNTAKFGDTIIIATDKPYAPVIEYGLYPKPGGIKTENGFSTQAPQGMVRITVQEMQAWLRSNLGKFY
ncbi:TPA: HK97 gp10 family phage protein [Pasteurella multocida]|uniref:HK97 gp10 family phage protein n=1 Tax=Pasteurella multocida TaxID=747 RepID=UPI0020227AD4|nr:HK97 gp10 family phage protein [Pasteurella multocida]MCL7790074.1 HK97 gp10 family phage protein [Pasteurella multocida]MDY0487085.1 HK97 gp10 family phage protein [Pasteurella multocida]MDY0536597.1 HK97 gp10 family phage protein [Pasteurella multocida]MDY0539015.1 HK97 gp10 family phage protein [Pasteurella multocida]MDY0557289.1 HK97 gp10 family phage protein [Pasteurella multocida]